jgi:hypothetical protein
MRDYRKSDRLAPSTSAMHCELIFGSVVLPALLLNESAKGFGVLASGMPHITASQTAQLHTYRGWFDCQIVYAMEVMPKTSAIYKAAGVGGIHLDTGEEVDEDGEAESHIAAYDIDKFTSSTQGPWFRLGIRSVRKLRVVSPEDTASSREGGRLVRWIKRLASSFFCY